MHENGWLNFPGHWLSVNLLTGLSYVWIAYVVRSFKGFIRDEYMKPFALFIAACGVHHISMAAVPLLPRAWFLSWQLVQGAVDAIMVSVSLLTAGFVLRDWIKIKTKEQQDAQTQTPPQQSARLG